MPYQWDLNLYRGCQHACSYCFALYTHQFLPDTDFYHDIYIKTNIVEQLDKQLSDPHWNHSIINIGSVSDSYQPAEAKYRLMPEILRLCLKYQNPIIISTKSTLIIRDLDLIAQLAEKTYVNIAATITCMDETVRSKIEPGCAPSIDRFKMLAEFRKTNVSLGLHMMPIIPYLTDSQANLEQICSLAASVNVDYLLPGVLYLRGLTRQTFFNVIKHDFNNLTDHLQLLYQGQGASQEYKNELYRRLNPLLEKYQLSTNYNRLIKSKMKQPSFEQLELFYD
ncbi:hypothetical protein SDC9_108331 [bioreactor metagenome]|uniref:Radical SAM core domain-containing protein n=1 Tax=bioreactor metagenome TaxID=1076179 RepID=A0A645B9Z7_9ZZZZ|nr:radical SAM protein [Erysipelotrichaceae bacterium]